VDRSLRDEALLQSPLHPNQHAYQAGKSTETALHQLVVRVDKVLERRDTALGVFLDIEGAFNDTSYDSITAALDRHGVSPTIRRWIRTTLEGRRATATLGGVSRSIAVARGCPQGGVLSPLLRCLAVDELLTRLNEGGFMHKDMRIFVTWQWVNSPTQYRGLYSGLCFLWRGGAMSTV
jgi:hypothetical protein